MFFLFLWVSISTWYGISDGQVVVNGSCFYGDPAFLTSSCRFEIMYQDSEDEASYIFQNLANQSFTVFYSLEKEQTDMTNTYIEVIY